MQVLNYHKELNFLKISKITIANIAQTGNWGQMKPENHEQEKRETTIIKDFLASQ